MNSKAWTFLEILTILRATLEKNNELKHKGVIQTESEWILTESFRMEEDTVVSRMDLYSDPESKIPPSVGRKAIQIAEKRAGGKLLQHLTGRQSFLKNIYEVNSKVLVPRPETEVLVSLAALDLKKRNSGDLKLGFEVGLGSGVISIELLSEFSDLQMIASEASPGAREVAKKNAQKILGSTHSSRLTILTVEDSRSVCECFLDDQQRGDFLISNPPYLSREDEADREVLKNEPHLALFPLGRGGEELDPLHFYREIAAQASRLLNPTGRVYLEIPPLRSEQIEELFVKQGWTVKIEKDLTGKERVLIAFRD